MANNTLINSDSNFLRILFLDAQSASASSDYFETTRMEKCTIHASALEVGSTLAVQGRNDISQPPNTLAGPVLFTLTSAVLLGVDNSRPRWIRVVKTAGATPAPTTVIAECTR